MKPLNMLSAECGLNNEIVAQFTRSRKPTSFMFSIFTRSPHNLSAESDAIILFTVHFFIQIQFYEMN